MASRAVVTQFGKEGAAGVVVKLGALNYEFGRRRVKLIMQGRRRVRV